MMGGGDWGNLGLAGMREEGEKTGLRGGLAVVVRAGGWINLAEKPKKVLTNRRVSGMMLISNNRMLRACVSLTELAGGGFNDIDSGMVFQELPMGHVALVGGLRI